MQAKAPSPRSPLTLRALRRDVAVLTAAAAVSISLSGWIHAQTCPLEAEPEVHAHGLRADVAVPAPAQTVVREAAPLRYGEHFAFVIDLEEPYVVLATDVEAAWEGEMDGLLGVDTVFRHVDVHALPASIRNMRGTELALWTTEADGQPVSLGTARIGAPRLVAQAAGSLGPEARLDTWSLYERLERDGALPAGLEARVKEAIWAEGLRLVVAPLEGGRASEATWARSAELPPPAFLEPIDLELAESAELRQAFLEHPHGRTAADSHAEQGFGLLAPHIHTQGWVDSSGRLELATAFVDSPHVDICGGFDEAFSLAADVSGDDWSRPTMIPSSHTVGPALVGDLNGDGLTDMLLEPRPLDGNTTVLRGTTEGLEEIETLGEVPYFGCRC